MHILQILSVSDPTRTPHPCYVPSYYSPKTLFEDPYGPFHCAPGCNVRNVIRSLSRCGWIQEGSHNILPLRVSVKA